MYKHARLRPWFESPGRRPFPLQNRCSPSDEDNMECRFPRRRGRQDRLTFLVKPYPVKIGRRDRSWSPPRCERSFPRSRLASCLLARCFAGRLSPSAAMSYQEPRASRWTVLTSHRPVPTTGFAASVPVRPRPANFVPQTWPRRVSSHHWMVGCHPFPRRRLSPPRGIPPAKDRPQD